ncbi:hypothetical protein [Desulfosporosinus sp. Sb-LF]|uniref:hypothetical protein n=1 Tax=Desulfosporosinus sp. Sb-LF TaxID=2560027 RepID=UPI001FB05226|nr:hypothetical protein [Desulfosporosinus sp. Sb-LF]
MSKLSPISYAVFVAGVVIAMLDKVDAVKLKVVAAPAAWVAVFATLTCKATVPVRSGRFGHL